MAAQFAMALRRYLEVHNHYDEARRWLKDAIARSERGAIAPALLAKVFNAAGALATAERDYEDAISLLQKSLDLQRNLGDDLAIVSALDNLGTMAISYALAD
jgi:Tfp pilus assembly protein PilF